MSAQAEVAVPWRELLACEAAGNGELLERALALWCERRSVGSAALYVAEDDVLRRRQAVGPTEFPAEVDPGADLPFARTRVAGAVLLSDRAAEGDTPEASALELVLGQAAEVQRLQEQIRRQSFQESYRLVELEAVYEVGLAIASTLELDELSEGVLLRAVSLSDARRGALYLLEDGSFELNRTIGGDARRRLEPDDEQLTRLDGEATVEQDLLPGARFALALPIEIDGSPRGLLAIGDKESRHGVGPFAEADRRTLGLFANQAAIALENAHLHLQALEKERLEREMELAADIQQRLLPKDVPQVDGYEMIGWNRPTWQVGGDYFDFLPLADGRLGLVVADVTGKGLAAALLVSTLHSSLQLLFEGVSPDEALLARLNEHIVHSSSPNKFITLILAELDPATAKLRSLNAGHNPGMLVRADGSISELMPSGMPLGLLTGSSYHAQNLDIGVGDLLCLFSDGITECTSVDDLEFGEERLEQLLLRERHNPLPEVMAAIDSAMGEFSAGCSQSDDQTVVLLRRTA